MLSLRFIFAVLLLAALAAAPAHAFTTDNSSDTNRDGSSKFSDPDDQLDEMTDSGSSSSAHPGMLQFGTQGGAQSYFGFGNSDAQSDRTTSAIR